MVKHPVQKRNAMNFSTRKRTHLFFSTKKLHMTLNASRVQSNTNILSQTWFVVEAVRIHSDTNFPPRLSPFWENYKKTSHLSSVQWTISVVVSKSLKDHLTRWIVEKEKSFKKRQFSRQEYGQGKHCFSAFANQFTSFWVVFSVTNWVQHLGKFSLYF